MNTSQFTSGYRAKLMITAYEKWINPGETILDVGCGTGIVAKILGNHFSTKIAECDVKNYLIQEIPFIKMVNNKIPVKNKIYDIALLNDVLHHINKEHQADTLIEAARVAKKVLVFEFEPTFVGKLADIILNKLHYGDLHAPVSVRTTNEWQNLFKTLGFESKVVKLKKPFWYPFSHIAFMLTKK